MTTALISDDNPVSVALLRSLLALEWPELEVVGEAADGLEAMALIDERQPDLVFLDIDMPHVSGLDVARALPSRIGVVFITSYSSFALNAFEVSALGYVLKPLTRDKIGALVNKLRKDLEQGHRVAYFDLADGPGRSWGDSGSKQVSFSADGEWISVTEQDYLRVIHRSAVLALVEQGVHTRVIIDDSEEVLDVPLQRLLAVCGHEFMQIRKDTYINAAHIVLTQTDTYGELLVQLSQHPAAFAVAPRYRGEIRRRFPLAA